MNLTIYTGLNFFTITLFLVMIFPQYSVAQNNIWNGKKAAVSLTYDDALHVHLDKVVPALKERDLLGTFYLTGSFAAMKTRTREWISVAESGHELGNHTLFHPCRGDLPNREWVNPDYDLSEYTVSRMYDEIKQQNILLETLDQKAVRTFAYPCGEMSAGVESYVDAIREDFIGARGVAGRFEHLHEVNLFNIGSFMINGNTGEELIELVNQALEQEALVVFLFHGVGGEHDLNVSLEAHNQLLDFLKSNKDDVWIAPLADIATYISDKQKSGK